MKAVYIAAVLVLLASLVGNWWQYRRSAELIAELESAEIAAVQSARKADDFAMQYVDRARADAAEKAQERRDALKDADSADTIADLLERCRRGLFGKDADRGVDAAQGDHGRVSKPANP